MSRVTPVTRRFTPSTAPACAAALLAALCASATAQQRAPSDAELRSMYCVEVLRAEITLQQHMISASSEAAGAAQPESRQQWIDTSAELLQGLARLEDALYRLQKYLLPRISTIDSVALASAIRQADADLQQARDTSDCENPTWLAL